MWLWTSPCRTLDGWTLKVSPRREVNLSVASALGATEGTRRLRCVAPRPTGGGRDVQENQEEQAQGPPQQGEPRQEAQRREPLGRARLTSAPEEPVRRSAARTRRWARAPVPPPHRPGRSC